ncbi:MAG TPA: aldehyde ferredoxin oxidoreductase family protein [Candidatus Acidoferrum sp.]|nr:aldehyde ferredoxin oxidoreductase family protein [Candidatus Acidoferrum sp.]
MTPGYSGMMLEVDLGRRRAESRPIAEDVRRQLLGGNGLGAWALYHALAPEVDAFAPENPLIFCSGPLSGTLAPIAPKMCAFAKSPLTNGYMDSISSAQLGTELKCAGYDLLLIRGAADTPTYVRIDDDRVTFEDARSLWGRSTFATQEAIRTAMGDASAKVLAIGPAGENRVRYAAILGEHRAFGGGGLGAVMGSKRLKAIVARGTGVVSVHDREGLFHCALRFMARVRRSRPAKVLSSFGTPVHTMILQTLGGLPTRNFQTGVLPGAENLSGEVMRETYTKRVIACPSCMTPCGMVTQVSDGEYGGATTLGPEFQAIATLGSLLGHARLDAVIALDRLCDELGVGQCSVGNVIAFAMECRERGVLSQADLDGLDLHFGNHRAAFELVGRIARREGIGDLLAEGVKRASQQLGRGTEDFACEVKGMEMTGFEPRCLKSQAIGFAVSNRGPIHNEVRPLAEFFSAVDWNRPEGVGRLAKTLSDWTALANCLVWCLSAERVLDFKPWPVMVELVRLVTGYDVDESSLVTVGERVQTIERLINVREGLTRSADRLPKRFVREALPEGMKKGVRVPQETLDVWLDEYYAERGWNRDGIPTSETIDRLGLRALLEVP